MLIVPFCVVSYGAPGPLDFQLFNFFSVISCPTQVAAALSPPACTPVVSQKPQIIYIRSPPPKLYNINSNPSSLVIVRTTLHQNTTNQCKLFNIIVEIGPH